MQYPFPEAILPKDKLNTSIKKNKLGPLAFFKQNNLEQFSYQFPDAVQSQLALVAETNLAFPRLWPWDPSSPKEHITNELPWLSLLRSAMRAGAWSLPIYLQKRPMEPEKALETIRSMFIISSKFRQAPGYQIEMLVAIALDEIVLEAANKMKTYKAVDRTALEELVRQYRPTRKQYAATLKYALNGDADVFANFIKIIFSKDAENLIREIEADSRPGEPSPSSDEIKSRINKIRKLDPQAMLREYNELNQEFVAAFQQGASFDLQKALEAKANLNVLNGMMVPNLDSLGERLEKILKEYDTKFPK